MARARRVELLVVGGGVAAARCIRTLRRARWTGSIILAGDEPHAPYNRPPLSKELLRDDVPVDLLAAEPPSWYERHAVELRTGTTVTHLDDGRATLADGTEITWDRCLIGTGAAPRRPPVPGAAHALVLRTVDDAVRLRSAARPGRRVVVVGGGFIGVEVAGSLAARGVATTILQRSPLLWGGSLGASVSAWATARLAEAGVDVRLGVTASALERGAVFLVDGSRLSADAVLVAVGVTPRAELASNAGITVEGGIAVDAGGRTSAERVWAAGDAASLHGAPLEHWHAARESGERAARSMLDAEIPPVRAPWAFTEVAGAPVDVLGAATAYDDEVVIGDVTDGRFGVALLERGQPRQVASVGGWADADGLRSLLERGGSLAELHRLPGS